MPLIDIPLALTADAARDTSLNPQRLINAYAEPIADGDVAVVACDGFAAFATPTGVAAGQLRGSFNLDETYLYYVSGSRLQYVTPGGGVVHLAEFPTTGHVYMARNRRGDTGIGAPQVGVMSSDGVLRIIESNVVSTPTLDPAIPSALFNSICSLDGYFIITVSNGEFYITAIDDGTDIDVLDFSSARSNPDGLLRGMVRGRELVLMGPRSTEWWQNTGAADFPFERAHASEMGIFAPAAAVAVMADVDGTLMDTIIWPATNRDGAYVGIMMMTGYDARKVSTTEIDRVIAAEATPQASIRACQYTRADGTTFYSISSSTWTYELNLRTKLWHKRTSAGLQRWRITDAVQFAGKTILGDYAAAKLYRIDTTLAPTADSALTLRHSNDFGVTWKSMRSQSIGGVSQPEQRARYNRLGLSGYDGKIFELIITNAIVEDGSMSDMTIVTPVVTVWPQRLILDTLWINFVPGASQSSRTKAIASAKAIARQVA